MSLAPLPAPAFLLTRPAVITPVRVRLRRPAAAARALGAAGAAAASCARQVALLQAALPAAGLGAGLALLSHGASPVGRASTACHVSGPASAAALSMQSLMRVAAMESPGVTWSTADLPSAAVQPVGDATATQAALAAQSQVQAAAAAAGGVDMYGRAAWGCAWLAPRLLVREPTASYLPKGTAGVSRALAAGPASHLRGAVVVTGGMGALGTVVASWLTGLGPGAKIWLLGRSGHTNDSPLPAGLYASNCQVVCAKGDVSGEQLPSSAYIFIFHAICT